MNFKDRLAQFSGELQFDDYSSRLMGSLLTRTGLIYDTREFRPTDVEKYSRDSHIVVSCISPSIVIADGAKDRGADLREFVTQDGYRLVQATEKHSHHVWASSRLDELEIALKSDPDIICYSEMAYPPPAPPVVQQGLSAASIRNSVRDQLEFEANVIAVLRRSELRRKAPPFICLGSYHCLLSLFNVGVIYPWGASLAPIRAWSNGTTEVIGPPFLYQKRFAARRAGEITRVPASQYFDTFDHPAGRICVLICSDVVDVNQFLTIAKRNLSTINAPIDIVLVPSFNTSERLSTMCRELSLISNNMVIVVNANHKDSQFPDTQMFSSGLDVSQMKDLKFLDADTVKTTVTSAKRGSRRASYIITFTINRSAINALRRETTDRWRRQGAPTNFVEALI